jgi:hypothetical protein
MRIHARPDLIITSYLVRVRTDEIGVFSFSKIEDPVVFRKDDDFCHDYTEMALIDDCSQIGLKA